MPLSNMLVRRAARRPRRAIPLIALLSLSIAAGLCATPPASAAPAPRVHTVHLSHAVDIQVDTYPAAGKVLLLWIAPSFGFHEPQRRMARLLAAEGLEVWQADVANALFLTRGSPGMRALHGRYVADLIERAHAATNKRIVLMSSSYGAIPVLRGAHQWQRRKPTSAYLGGAILFSPNIYATVPSLGLEPQYLPIVHATNIPIVILQGGINGNRWQLPRLVAALRGGGATVYTEVMPGITGLYFGHKENGQALAREFARTPGRIKALVPLLLASSLPLQALPLASAPKSTGRGLDAELTPFTGDPHPQALHLRDANGHMHTIKNYRGRVTVVNFWATWCPPCVREIPSLNRLRKAMHGQPFRLVSVNYAAGPKAIHAFMKKVNVDYPVLIDRHGREAAKWKVVVFPSTFVIGPDGLIRYGVNAGLEWDDPRIVDALRQLAHGVAPTALAKTASRRR